MLDEILNVHREQIGVKGASQFALFKVEPHSSRQFTKFKMRILNLEYFQLRSKRSLEVNILILNDRIYILILMYSVAELVFFLGMFC